MMMTFPLSRLRSTVFAAVCLAVGAAPSTSAKAQQTSTPQQVIVSDFNHDGIPDVLTPSGTAAAATIAFGTVPYGTFSAGAKAVTFPAACTSFPQGSLLTGDFNGDGLADIAFFCGTASGVMLGNGDGTFGAPKLLDISSSQLAVTGDFNNDGKLDLAVIGLAGDSVVTNNIQFLAGNGDGTFAPAKVTPLPQQGYTAPIVADIDGDGSLDIVLGLFATNTDTSPSVNVLGNNKDGTFGVVSQGFFNPSASANVAISAAVSILAGNFFGNDVNDLIVPDNGATPGLFLIQNTSTVGKFSLGAPTKTTVTGLTAALPGVFSGTGATDLFIANGTTISAYNNDGSGTFAADYAGLSVASSSALFAVADANLDGYSDIYIATLNAGNLQLGVDVTSGSATATSQPFSLSIGTHAISAIWNGDVNLLASTATGQQIVAGAVTVASVASSSNPSTFGNPVTFNVAISPSVPIDSVPTGSVILMDGTTMLSTGALANGAYSYTTSTLSVATHLITAIYSGDNYFAASTSPVLSQVVSHAPAVTPTLTWTAPAAIVYGTALSATQLDATAVDTTGTAIPGTFVYTPAAGTVLDAGTRTLSVTFTPTDLLSFLPATKTVTLTVTQAAPILNWPVPASIVYGVALSGTQLDAAAAGVSGAALPGTFTYTPAAGTVPAIGVQTLSVNFVPANAVDYTGATGTVKLTVIPPNVVATVTAPPTTPPGSQPTITVTLTQPYPVDLVGTLTIGFTRTGTPQITDPSLQFAAGGTTFSFPIPANTTTTPVIQLQAGTIAGTITVPLVLTAGGVNVTPTGLAPVTIVVPPAVPSVSGMTLTRSGDQMTVVIHGFSNTREVVNAMFHFTAAPGASIGTPDLTLPADTIFNTEWFDTDASDTYGSTFTYTQIFNTSDGAANIGSVDAVLTNSVGASTSTTAK